MSGAKRRCHYCGRVRWRTVMTKSAVLDRWVCRNVAGCLHAAEGRAADVVKGR